MQPAIVLPGLLCGLGGVYQMITSGGFMPVLLLVLSVMLTIAMWAITMRSALVPVLILRTVERQPVWEWQYWLRNTADALPDQARWRFNRREVYVLDRMRDSTAAGIVPFTPLSDQPVTATPERVARFTLQRDRQEVNKSYAGRLSKEIIKNSVLIATILGLLLLVFVIAQKLVEM